MSFYLHVEHGLYVTSSSEILIPENAAFWQLSDEEKVQVLQSVRAQLKYVDHLNIIEWLDNNDKGNNRLVFLVQSRPGAIEAFKEASANPLMTAKVRKMCAELYERYQKELNAKAFKRTAYKSIRSQVVQRDKSACRYCGSELSSRDCRIDHVIPYSLGGRTELDNLVVACSACNGKKSGNTLEEAGMKLLAQEEL